MSTSPSTNQVKVLVTGFGPFLDVTDNPSWGIARQLPSTITGLSGEAISVVVPTQPLPAAYYKLATVVPQLIEENNPDLIVHMGLDVESGPGVFKVEQSAPKEGYHNYMDVEKKVFTRAENKKAFGKSSASLITSLNLDTAVQAWQLACHGMHLSKSVAPSAKVKTKGKGKNEEKQALDIRQSDDVGTYVCGLNYYVSMMEMQKRTGKRNVVFFHVPKLDTQSEIAVGVKVTEELIKALVSVYK